MKRVAFVITTPTFGGPHNQALRLHNFLLELGWEQLIITTNEPGNGASRLEKAGVPVRRIPLHRLRKGPTYWNRAASLVHILQDIPALTQLFRGENIDVVQFAGIQNLHVALSARRAGLPVVAQLLSTYAPRWMRRAMAPLASQLVSVVMSTGITVAKEHPGIVQRGQPLICFYPPIDIDAFAIYVQKKEIVRAQLNIPSNGIGIITLGNFVPQKAHDILIKSAELLLKQRQYPSVYFRIMGTEVYTYRDYYRYLIDKARRSGLFENDRLRFVEAGARAHELLAAGDIFVLSSIAEGIPTAMLEAMALGMPVVATAVGSVEEVLQEAKAGICVPPRKPELLAAALRRLIEDEAMRKKMSENALAFAREHLDVRHCAMIHAEAYELAIKHSRG